MSEVKLIPEVDWRIYRDGMTSGPMDGTKKRPNPYQGSSGMRCAGQAYRSLLIILLPLWLLQCTALSEVMNNATQTVEQNSATEGDPLPVDADSTEERPGSETIVKAKLLEPDRSSVAIELPDSKERFLPSFPGQLRTPDVLSSLRRPAQTFLLSKSEKRTILVPERLSIEIDPSKLELPEACNSEPLQGDLWMIEGPLDAIANGIHLDANAPESPTMLESSLMFYFNLRCGEEPVRLRTGETLSMRTPSNMVPDGAGFYRMDDSGWSVEGRSPDVDGTLFRLTFDAEDPSQLADVLAQHISESGTIYPWHGAFANGSMDIFVPHGENRLYEIMIARHETEFISLEGDRSQPVRALGPLKLSLLEGQREERQWFVLRRTPLDQSRAWPDGMPEGCYLSVVRKSVWRTERLGLSTEHFRPDVRVYTQPEGSEKSKLIYENSRSIPPRDCISQEVLEANPGPVEIQLLYRDNKPESIFLGNVYEPTSVVLALTQKEEHLVGNSISTTFWWSSDSPERLALTGLGLWNIDYPRSDLVCVQGSVDFDGDFMVSAIPLNRFGQSIDWARENQFRTKVPRGGSIRILVVADDAAGLSDVIHGGILDLQSDNCIDTGKIELKTIPSRALESQTEFLNWIGL